MLLVSLQVVYYSRGFFKQLFPPCMGNTFKLKTRSCKTFFCFVQLKLHKTFFFCWIEVAHDFFFFGLKLCKTFFVFGLKLCKTLFFSLNCLAKKREKERKKTTTSSSSSSKERTDPSAIINKCRCTYWYLRKPKL